MYFTLTSPITVADVSVITDEVIEHFGQVVDRHPGTHVVPEKMNIWHYQETKWVHSTEMPIGALFEDFEDLGVFLDCKASPPLKTGSTTDL